MLPLTRSRGRSRFFGLAIPQSALDLNFLSGVLDPRITFTRASSGTYFDNAGLLQTASNDVPRFDFDPATLTARGLLIEVQRTNSLLHNRDLTDVTWIKTNVTSARNQVGIDGAANAATRLTASAANGTVLQTITSASAARATSAYVRRVTGTGTVEMTQDNGVTWTAITVPATWGRVTIPSATVTNPVVGFRIVTSGDAIDVDYVQCENGAFATSAIATTAAAATRSADLAVMTGSNFSSWYRMAEGTFSVRYSSVSAPNLRSFAASDGTNNNVIECVAGTSVGTGVLFSIRESNTAQANVPASITPVTDQVYNVAGAYALNDVGASRDGNISTDSVANIPTVDRLYIGAGGAATNQLNGHIRRLVYWPVRVPNAQLQFIAA